VPLLGTLKIILRVIHDIYQDIATWQKSGLVNSNYNQIRLSYCQHLDIHFLECLTIYLQSRQSAGRSGKTALPSLVWNRVCKPHYRFTQNPIVQKYRDKFLGYEGQPLRKVDSLVVRDETSMKFAFMTGYK
jgi:hypothetical protein